MSAELRRAKVVALTARQAAAVKTAKNLADACGVSIVVRDWSISVAQEFDTQWCARDIERHTDSDHWDWREIARRYHAPKEQVISFWLAERLCALALITATREAVTVEFLEGDPRPDNPLKGLAAAAALEYAVLYGQSLGCNEIHLHPVNATLEALYCDGYGFEMVAPRKGQPFLKRKI